MPFFSNNVTLFFYDIFPIFCMLLFCHISQSFYSSLLFFSCPIFFPSDLFISTHFYFPFSVYLWFSNLLRCFLLFTFTPPSKNPSLRTAFLEQIMSCTNTIEMRVVRLCSVFSTTFTDENHHRWKPPEISIGQAIVDDEYAPGVSHPRVVLSFPPLILTLSISLYLCDVYTGGTTTSRVGETRQLINRHNRAPTRATRSSPVTDSLWDLN